MVGAAALVVILVVGAAWPVAVSGGWDASAAVVLGWTWFMIMDHNPTETAKLARKEDSSRGASDTILLTACIASLVAVGYVLARAGHGHGATKELLIALAVSSVALAWLTVHTLFALRYARIYYGSDPPGGVDFHAADQPDFRDFAYTALTIGMTFQVSDNDLTTKAIRRVALRHAMISFVFGAVIVAITINVVAGLLGH